ncbi:fatty-acyl-CoA synthase/long-chain acyl-CoA synthetase [Actinomycetospora succinea]|uniref:Fatty-acyl-CoA synthase/long-chain acyl-CoA synthetase n=1 Tax=Actinomycetospora succinea TaxID=663603 RepID=A0A4V3D8A6_9PSEU|nr:AMP-binding protein [Actinomycetospora succinea]TDQ50897.1 fatty-acyl-CoA synthase/long-chain acyl-CoA synthetase [Actinomycetospora succinea]
MRSTLGAEFAAALHRYRDRTAIESGGESWTFADVERRARAVVAQLRAYGVEAGDAVALHLGNGVEFVVADVAIALMGAVKVPVNPLLPASTVQYIVTATQARVVIVDPVFGVDHPAPVILKDELATEGPLDALPAPVGPGARAAIYFTGGTTGKPKGVVHTQASAVAVHYAQLLEAEIVQDDRLLLTTPLAHAAGLFAQSALIRGATSVIEDGFDAERVLDAVRARGITWTFLVPTMLYRLLDAVDGPEPFGLRTVVYGAAPITPARLTRALEVFGPVFVQLYGQTECPNWGTRLAKDDHDPARPELLDSCGRASIMADVAIVDDQLSMVPAGETGEVCLRSPYVLEGYLDDPSATADKFLPGGWIRTGDVGFLDDAGYLHLRDRRADMVISGGMNVYCSEVENVLAEHPGVAQVAVIGVPHDDWGEAVHAVIVGSVGVDEILEWSRGRLAAYARPKSAELVDDLPVTPFGKVDKKALRAPHWAGRERAIG